MIKLDELDEIGIINMVVHIIVDNILGPKTPARRGGIISKTRMWSMPITNMEAKAIGAVLVVPLNIYLSCTSS